MQLLDLYSKADLLLLLSEHEAYSLVVADALASGTPCLVGNTSALSEWVDDKSCFGINLPTLIGSRKSFAGAPGLWGTTLMARELIRPWVCLNGYHRPDPTSAVRTFAAPAPSTLANIRLQPNYSAGTLGAISGPATGQSASPGAFVLGLSHLRTQFGRRMRSPACGGFRCHIAVADDHRASRG